MDGQRNQNGRPLLVVSICIALSALLSNLSLGSLLFNLPLLLIAPKIKKTSHAVLSFAVSLLLVVAVSLFNLRDYLSSEYLGVILFSLFFQVVSSIGAMVWVALRGYSDSVLRKLVICSFPVAILGIGFAILLTLPGFESYTESLRQSVAGVFSLTSLGIDVDKFTNLFMTVLLLVTVPVGMIFNGFPILVSELVLNKKNENWQNNFSYMKMPNYYVWIFMACWLLVILSSFVEFPIWLNIATWNIAFGLSIHYMLSGFSILIYFVRKKSAAITANRLFGPVVMLCIIPGINIPVVFGLAILGALETWIKMR